MVCACGLKSAAAHKEDIVVIAMTQHMDNPAAGPVGAQLKTLVYSALIGK